jgi:hypothetical protein
MKLEFLDGISKNTETSNLKKIRAAGVGLLYADERTDRETR